MIEFSSKTNRDSTHQHSVPGRCDALPTRAPPLRDQRRQSDSRLHLRPQQPEPGHPGWFIPTPTHSISSSFIHSFIHSLYVSCLCFKQLIILHMFFVCMLRVCVHAVRQPGAVPGAGPCARHVTECQQGGGG